MVFGWVDMVGEVQGVGDEVSYPDHRVEICMKERGSPTGPQASPGGLMLCLGVGH